LWWWLRRRLARLRGIAARLAVQALVSLPAGGWRCALFSPFKGYLLSISHDF